MSISPDPVVITLGKRIIWNIETDPIVIPISEKRIGMSLRMLVKVLRVTIYFNSRSPFKKSRYTVLSKSKGKHTLSIKTEPAKKLGEYKYGVNLKNADNGEEIEDEDPYIIVK